MGPEVHQRAAVDERRTRTAAQRNDEVMRMWDPKYGKRLIYSKLQSLTILSSVSLSIQTLQPAVKYLRLSMPPFA